MNDSISLDNEVILDGKYKTFNVGIHVKHDIGFVLYEFLKFRKEYPIFLLIKFPESELMERSDDLQRLQICYTIKNNVFIIEIRDKKALKEGIKFLKFYIENGNEAFISFSKEFIVEKNKILFNTNYPVTFLYVYEVGFSIFSNEEEFSSIQNILTLIPKEINIDSINTDYDESSS